MVNYLLKQLRLVIIHHDAKNLVSNLRNIDYLVVSVIEILQTGSIVFVHTVEDEIHITGFQSNYSEYGFRYVAR